MSMENTLWLVDLTPHPNFEVTRKVPKASFGVYHGLDGRQLGGEGEGLAIDLRL